MWRIVQVDGRWELRSDEGAVRAAPTYAAALAVLGEASSGAAEEALLPEWWESDGGIAFPEATGDGRDFSGVTWSWRDPATEAWPLMVQTETASAPHEGAAWAGFATEVWVDGGNVPQARGRLFDSDAGRAARDLMAAQGWVGVSVDGGAVEAEFVCIDEDPEVGCVDGVWVFEAFEVIGLTVTPFPAFARAAIRVAEPEEEPEGQEEEGAEPVGVVAAGSLPARADFFLPEPQAGSPLLVTQPDGSWAVPLTVTDDGRVFGHVARWGQCHVGMPQECVTAPASSDDYPLFHVGEVATRDGGRVATGVLTIGCDHADGHRFAAEARDHYAHTGMAWADVRLSNGAHGVWCSGRTRPLSDDQLAAVRASAPSGDWRWVDGRYEMVAVLSVNTPGFPVARGLAASARERVVLSAGVPVSLVGSGMVARVCATCRDAAVAPDWVGRLEEQLVAAARHLAVLERRTRHLIGVEAATVRDRIR